MINIIEKYIRLLYTEAEYTQQTVQAQFTNGEVNFNVTFNTDNIKLEIRYPEGKEISTSEYPNLRRFLNQIEQYKMIPVINEKTDTLNMELLNSIYGMKEIRRLQNYMETNQKFTLEFPKTGLNICYYIASDNTDEIKYYKVTQAREYNPFIVSSIDILRQMYNGRGKLL